MCVVAAGGNGRQQGEQVERGHNGNSTSCQLCARCCCPYAAHAAGALDAGWLERAAQRAALEHAKAAAAAAAQRCAQCAAMPPPSLPALALLATPPLQEHCLSSSLKSALCKPPHNVQLCTQQSWPRAQDQVQQRARQWQQRQLLLPPPRRDDSASNSLLLLWCSRAPRGSSCGPAGDTHTMMMAAALFSPVSPAAAVA